MENKTTKEKLFLSIRLLIILFGLVTSLTVVQPVPDYQLPSPFLLFVLVPAIFTIVIGVQFFNPISDSTWQPPSWWLNPFNISQPYQFSHLAFCFFLASGVGLAISSTYSSNSLKYGLCQVAFGLGGIVGINISQYIYARKNP